MIFRIASTTCIHNRYKTSVIMILVCVAMLPSIILQFYFFGWGTVYQIFLSCSSTLLAESLVLGLRKKPVRCTLTDNSALLTGLLLAVSIPPLTPWWVVVIGAFFAIIIAKQLYGGLGQNPFNPAMTAYIVLLISFPVYMTSWILPDETLMNKLNCTTTLRIIFGSYAAFDSDLSLLRAEIDGISQATPLDTFKTFLHTKNSPIKMIQYSPYNSIQGITSWQWINLVWLLSGLFLIWRRVICWRIPTSFLISISFWATLGWIFSPNLLASPQFHLLSGATMLGAFFILTDPVTASTTNHGQLIFGALAGLLVWIIRSFGGYPDGVAFAVLLTNTAAPLIDYCTRPRVYGQKC